MTSAPPPDPATDVDELPADGTPPRGGGARATLLVGLGVAAAFLVGMAAVALLTDAPGPSQDGVRIGTDRPSLEDRVAPTDRAPLPQRPIDGFGEDAAAVDLAEYRGTPLVVNFWASWCAPCVREMPDFQAFSDQVGDRVPLLGVNVQDAPANARAFVEELGITYDLASDPRGELYAEVRGFGMPTTLFVDDAGTIVYRHTGPLDAEDLRRLVGEHLGVEV
jgi:cytochrome c biogenesis protein CcmG, thiol:disulfide interchange protein DsbE